MKKFLTLFALTTFFIFECSVSFAGVLLTKNKQAEVGSLIESDTSISLQSQFGAVDFKKENLIWYSIDKEIDSLLKAAQKAREEGNNEGAMALYAVSAEREPSTKSIAIQESQVLKLATQKSPEISNTLASATEVVPNSPEDKIKRGQQLVDSAKNLKSLTFIDKRVGEENKKLAEKNEKEGQKLIDEGKKELEAIKAQEVAAAAAATS
jgi:hypothetical protein